MSPTTNPVIAPRPARRRPAWAALAPCLAAVLAVAACGGSDNTPTIDAAVPPMADAAVPCNPSHPAMTYTQLYATFFAADAPNGHCAKSGCHGDPDHNVWLCGPTKDSCYAGMLSEGLINAANPVASLISNPKMSPLEWVSPDTGYMPADNVAPFPAGRDAINDWALACAQNN